MIDDFFIKTDISVDLNRLRQDYLKNINDNWKIYNNRICINRRTECDNEDLDSKQSLIYSPYEYIVPCFKGTVWEETLNMLPGKKGRARIMIMPPFKLLDLHRDFERRWHIALFTDPACMMIDYENNKTYHIPSDGYVYDVNTTMLHTAINSTTSIYRVHLVVCQYV